MHDTQHFMTSGLSQKVGCFGGRWNGARSRHCTAIATVQILRLSTLYNYIYIPESRLREIPYFTKERSLWNRIAVRLRFTVFFLLRLTACPE